MKNWSRRRRALVFIPLTLVLLITIPYGVLALSWRVAFTGDPAATATTRGQDALWLGHAWVDGRKSASDISALAKQLEGTGIRDLYVHTGPLEHDGSLPLATVSPKARWFTDAVHQAMPKIRVQAWLGDVVQPEKNPGMDLEDAAVRDRVTTASGQVLDQGFDGIHFDLEPVQSGSQGFLSLLDQVHAMTSGRSVPLSVAAAQINPAPGMNGVLVAVSGMSKWWSKSYFADVASRVEQIAVMSYDTWTPLESLYGGYVAQQTEMALEVTPAKVDLLMGVPFYWEDNFSHRGSAETVEAAVRGAQLGLGDSDRRNFGLALYVDFAATDANWTAYRDTWCTNL
ncbi:glycoside hydrolase family 18 protein [Kribbella sancticallisti]|uniref:Glycoside hydrolase family 18 protein n=1 Tax=Kribbella sancticallisti TaxID=460087 RepID=A0ABN2EHX6_9ACTN